MCKTQATGGWPAPPGHSRVLFDIVELRCGMRISCVGGGSRRGLLSSVCVSVCEQGTPPFPHICQKKFAFFLESATALWQTALRFDAPAPTRR